MKLENINIWAGKKRVLVAPLDWGLGHATRCIPIIYELLAQDIEVVIAADGSIKNLLKKEFPDVVFTHLKGYEIRYSRAPDRFFAKIALQFPKLLRSIYTEHQQLKKIIRNNKIDAVIADNRLGLYHNTIPCIYITHQLNIKTGNSFTEWCAQKMHYFFINKYTACWVPDNAAAPDLAGALSHPQKLPNSPVQYIGPLSRFEKIVIEKKYDLLILLSGPEPQRGLLEELLLDELKSYTGTALLVKGLPADVKDETTVMGNHGKVTVVDHLNAVALSTAIQQSTIVICRSGYTTIMDLVKLQQQAILIPTPGQTEQEYLAHYLMDKKLFISISQHQFSLKVALQELAAFSFAHADVTQDSYREVVQAFVKQLQPPA